MPLDKNAHEDLFKNMDGFKRYSRKFNIDMAPKILFSRSDSVTKLLDSGAANYFEFNNVNDNFFYTPSSTEAVDDEDFDKRQARLDKDMVKIPFSKAEIFTSTVLSFKEKRQLVKVIEMCLQATDQLAAGQVNEDDEEESKEKES